MKNLTKVLAVMLVVFCFAFIFACNKAEKPLLDLSEARDNLEDRNYDVDFERNIDAGYGAMVSVLEAGHYDNDDYIEIYVFKNKKLAKACYEAVKAENEANIAYYKAQIKFYEEILNSCSDDMKSTEIDKIEDKIKEYKDEIKVIEKEILGISGEYVWIGTIGAIEDTH